VKPSTVRDYSEKVIGNLKVPLRVLFRLQQNTGVRNEKGVGGRVWGVGNPIHKCRGFHEPEVVFKSATRLKKFRMLTKH